MKDYFSWKAVEMLRTRGTVSKTRLAALVDVRFHRSACVKAWVFKMQTTCLFIRKSQFSFQLLVSIICERWRHEFSFCFFNLTTYALGICFCLWSWCKFFVFFSCVLPWIHRTSAICVCFENIWTKKEEKCTSVSVHCVIMSIYAFIFVSCN